MQGGFRTESAARLIALWLVALAIAVRVVFAQGLMPVAEHGAIRITLCTGQGPVTAMLDVDGAQHGDQGQMAQQSCPFALAALPFALPAPALAPLAPIVPVLPAIALPPAGPRAPPAAPPPPATGPPILA